MHDARMCLCSKHQTDNLVLTGIIKNTPRMYLLPKRALTRRPHQQRVDATVSLGQVREEPIHRVIVRAHIVEELVVRMHLCANKEGEWASAGVGVCLWGIRLLLT